MIPRGASYWLKGKLYLALTNELNCGRSLLSIKGPSFQLPLESSFEKLPENSEPNLQQIFDIVDQAFEENKINVTSMDSDEITFAGFGDPLLRVNTLQQAIESIREKRHGVPFRVKTFGLFDSKATNMVNIYKFIEK